MAIRLHNHAKNQIKKIIGKIRKMPNTQYNGQKTGMMYCEHCILPSIEERIAKRKEKEIRIKWCVFCDQQVVGRIVLKKQYLVMMKNLSLIYKGLRKNI